MIRRELLVFLLVGASTVALDWSGYRLLLLADWPVDAAKALGFLLGTVFAYVANRFGTFAHQKQHRGSLWKFALLYLVTLGLNVGLNALVLQWGQSHEWAFALTLAFVLATGASAISNFLGMKFWVFQSTRLKESKQSQPSQKGRR